MGISSIITTIGKMIPIAVTVVKTVESMGKMALGVFGKKMPSTEKITSALEIVQESFADISDTEVSDKELFQAGIKDVIEGVLKILKSTGNL